jgi:DNA-binding NarL/FixJ family response regulator
LDGLDIGCSRPVWSVYEAISCLDTLGQEVLGGLIHVSDAVGSVFAIVRATREGPDDHRGQEPRRLPRAQALVLSATGDRAEIARAVESGAAGVLHKSSEMAEVADAVRRLRAGQTLMPLDEIVELLRFAGARKDEEHEARRTISSLTERELEVLSLLAEGLEAQEIAARLHISAKSERNHVASILSKLGVHSRLQAVLFAGRHGLVGLGTKGT